MRGFGLMIFSLHYIPVPDIRIMLLAKFLKNQAGQCYGNQGDKWKFCQFLSACGYGFSENFQGVLHDSSYDSILSASRLLQADASVTNI